ncbi:MAG: hypothetical protein J7647_05135 [Cyanobacteria bacterium SBLK]|nr:hypothetical protein [Cyanobacteria bacterium SBLK]
MVKLHSLKILTLFVSPFLLACAGPGWRTVEAQFGTQNVEIATCSFEQIERCEELKMRLEAGETITILDPEYVRYLAMGKDRDEWGNHWFDRSSFALFNTIRSSGNRDEWIAEVWIQEQGRLKTFESLFSLSPDLAIELAFSSIYLYESSFGNEYNPDYNNFALDDDESYINLALAIHRKKIRYTGPLTIGKGNTGTRGCSFPPNELLERQFLDRSIP